MRPLLRRRVGAEGRERDCPLRGSPSGARELPSGTGHAIFGERPTVDAALGTPGVRAIYRPGI